MFGSKNLSTNVLLLKGKKAGFWSIMTTALICSVWSFNVVTISLETILTILCLNYLSASFFLGSIRYTLQVWQAMDWYGFWLIFGGLAFFYSGSGKALKSFHPSQVAGADTMGRERVDYAGSDPWWCASDRCGSEGGEEEVGIIVAMRPFFRELVNLSNCLVWA
ncbi:hypothetical protein PILCRDRAFT_90846 [Piloderma croceum F 1598]|uniref:Uncharacterized protein n=1 Tax=Piloderma croceum (strain F 1598) TaxID=765440 RepID=A0A0C3F033_PILCF|nr:hypothetical protein PILCRDRAFT_90846 [Piloderma croceum F 1598]